MPVGSHALGMCFALQDYWHHWEDVTVGFFLGVLCAFVSYRQHYPGIASHRAGEAFVISKGVCGSCTHSFHGMVQYGSLACLGIYAGAINGVLPLSQSQGFPICILLLPLRLSWPTQSCMYLTFGKGSCLMSECMNE